jgi:hypothetical protein
MRRGLWKLNDAPFHTADSIYIGVANNPEVDGYHHYYLMYDDTRFDGKWGEEVIISKRKGSQFASKGVLFKLKLPRSSIDRVARAVRAKRGTETKTCLHGLCEVLTEAGILVSNVQDREHNVPAASLLTWGLLSDAVRRETPTTTKPVAVEMIATDEAELLFFLKTAAKVDAESRRELLKAGVDPGLGLADGPDDGARPAAEPSPAAAPADDALVEVGLVIVADEKDVGWLVVDRPLQGVDPATYWALPRLMRVPAPISK